MNKGGQRVKILHEREKEYEVTKGKKNYFERVKGGKVIAENRNKVKKRRT